MRDESSHFDLDAPSWDALEPSAVLAYAASFAATAPGRRLLASVLPSTSAGEINADHDAVEEAAAYLEKLGRLVPVGVPDPEPAREGLLVDGAVVPPLRLRDLATALIEAASLRKCLTRIDVEGFTALPALGRRIPDLSAAAAEVVAGVAPDGRIEDGASAELRRIRAAIQKTSERLRRQLESFVNDPSAAAIVRDDFVTQRNGRYVIPVRADSPHPVEGIVHAASSSGQTLFVEPIQSVALNNDLVRLAEQETAEHERILRGWTARFRSLREDIAAAIDGLARADSLQARALFRVEIDGCRPRLAAGAPVRLIDARHPLLDRRLKGEGARCVPVSIEIDPFDSVLVISGPNTGGKTVALKTAGLACLMAQCGLPVAARECVLPVFRQVRADIGDHQSIDADLSTFSAHVRAVASYLDTARPPALFLFDEIGTGTEPGEGAALAQAVLEQLLASGVTSIATTHHAKLKTWAFTAEGVLSAAMEFDEATLQPTYRVIPGAAGSSAGLSIAQQLGLSAPLVARARELVSGVGISAEEHMARLRELTAESEARVAELVRRGEALELKRMELDRNASAEAERQRRESRRALESALAEFRALAEREVAEIKDAKERAKVEKVQMRSSGRVAASARAHQGTLAPQEGARSQTPWEPAPGAKVRIVSLERDGEIVSVRGTTVEVRMGTTTFTVSRDDVTAPGGEPARVQTQSKWITQAAASRSTAHREESDDGPAPELHLLGRTVDEALPMLDQFLDASVRSGRTEVRVVHGHGTGRLRIAVRAHLKGHPHVDAFRPGGDGEGGDGATVVTLR